MLSGVYWSFCCLLAFNYTGDDRNYQPTLCTSFTETCSFYYEGILYLLMISLQLFAFDRSVLVDLFIRDKHLSPFIWWLVTKAFWFIQVHSDHHEVVADLIQTSFLFSIPMDGPMSFSTHYVSVQWALRFEFFTTPKNADLSRYLLAHVTRIFCRCIIHWSKIWSFQ